MPTKNIPYVGDAPEAFYELILGGKKLPGVAKIDGLSFKNKWDVTPAPGTDGAWMVQQGYEPATFSINCMIYERAQWQEWFKIVSAFRPKPGKKRATAIDVVHPELAAYDILRVVVNEVKPKVENHEYIVDIECTQWFPQPKPKTLKPLTGSDNDITGQKKEDYDKAIAAKAPSTVKRSP